MINSTIPMRALNSHVSAVGNKVKNLAILEHLSVRVPRGFGLPYSIYEDHVSSLLPYIQEIVERENDYAKMAQQIHAVITTSPLRIADDIISSLESYISGASYFAVRSSGNPVINGVPIAEDSQEASLAGQYESYLFVPAHNVPNAILWCFASLFSERCLEQFRVKEDPNYLQSRMSVLVQEMCPADLSAVVMTTDPIEGGDNFGMEITYGACESIVSGEVQGDLYLISRTDGNILSTQIGTKTSRIDYNPMTNMEVINRTSKVTSIDQRSCYAAPQELVSQIFEIGMFIERHFGTPQDIELVVFGNEIVVTQTRPITTSNSNS